MATVTSLGSGSGLDLEGLVTKLMDAERIPLTTLQTKESSFNTKISALGSLKSSLSALQTTAQALTSSVGQTALNKFATYSATVADTTIASATAAAGAIPGNYSLIIRSLAQGQQYQSSPALAPANGDSLTFAFATNGATRNTTITLGSTNNSLNGLRDAINAANIGVSATIVNGSAGAQLVLTGQGGQANAFTMTGTGGLASAFTQTAAAQDASFSINGIAATSSTNTATGVLDGITLNLNKISPSTTVTGTTTYTATTITVTQDNTTNLTSSLNGFIKAYNSSVSLMATQGAYDQTTKVSGPLQGNSTLRNAQNTVRNLLFSTTAGGSSTYQRLSDIGVTIGSDGTLTLDSTKLNTALSKDANGVAAIVSAVGTSYNKRLDLITSTTGSIQIATNSANSLVKSLTSREAAMQQHLTAVEANYRKQFTALDTLVASMKNTSSYLAQQLASLPGAASTSK